MDEEDREEREEIECEDRPLVKKGRLRWFRTRRLLGALALALSFTVIGFLLVRIFSASTPNTMKQLVINETVAQAYEENGTLTLQYQNQDTITRSEKAYGYFAVPVQCYIPEAEQWQAVVRINKSTLEKVANDYGLSESLSRDTCQFDVTLVIQYEDGSETRYHSDGMTETQKGRYNYYRFSYENAPLTEDVTAVYLDFYYIGDVDYEAEPYGTLRLFNFDNEYAWKYYDLSSAEKKMLEAWE